MKLNSRDLFARQTLASWRNVVAASISTILISMLGINDDSWAFLSKSIPPDKFTIIAIVALSGFLIVHLVNWYADYIAYTKWFSINSVPRNSIDSLGSIENAQDPTSGLFKRITEVTEAIEKADSFFTNIDGIRKNFEKNTLADHVVLQQLNEQFESNNRHWKEIKANVNEVMLLADKLETNWKVVDRTSKTLIFGWFLLVPILLYIGSVILVLC